MMEDMGGECGFMAIRRSNAYKYYFYIIVKERTHIYFSGKTIVNKRVLNTSLGKSHG
jgi:hypothetical protein